VFLGVQQHLTVLAWSDGTVTLLVQAFASALSVVIITHMYLRLTAVMRWVLTIFDTLIPYLLGSGEIWMALAAGHSTSWWAALSWLSLVGTFAFSYTKIRTTQAVFGTGRETFERQHRWLALAVILCLLILLPSGSLALLNYLRACPPWLNICMVFWVTIIGVFLIAQAERQARKLYGEYGLS
jgi:hypothetical protein